MNPENLSSPTRISWLPDLLGSGFEMVHIDLPDDYAGKVRTTAIRRLADVASTKAILYIHGFSDYFFQKELAVMFAANGFNFYAVDLRKYGRSLLPGQKMFQVRNLHEYFADIDAAKDIILADGNSEIILLGHSTGGLTSALYMAEKRPAEIKALMLNSPFLDWNLPPPLRDVAIPVISALGRFFPNARVHQKPDPGYARSLLREYGGEWEYRKEWKPDILPDPDMGWVRAIYTAQKQLRKLSVNVPVLLMHSAESVKKGDPADKYRRADTILDVESISRRGLRLGPDVTEIIFPGALHDIALSRKTVRHDFYTAMLTWLRARHL